MIYFYQKMNIIFKYALIVLVVFSTIQLEAQDPRFSQFYNAPTHMNPALTGVFNGKYRLMTTYRSQYGTILASNPYQTISAAFDMRHAVLKNDFAAWGVSFLNDDAGVSNFKRTEGTFDAAFHKYLGGNPNRDPKFLIAGAQVGFGQRSMNWEQLWFSNQFKYGDDFAFIDYDEATGEQFENMNTGVFFDFNAGLAWYGIFDKNKSAYVGAAMYHITKPNVSFLQDPNARLDPRYVIQAGGEFPVGLNTSLVPAAAVMLQGAAFSTTAGMSIRYSRRDWKEIAIRAGVWSHISNRLQSDVAMEAMIVSAILETEQLNFGLSYDITTSVLKEATNSRGAFEVSVAYIHPGLKRKMKTICPNF